MSAKARGRSQPAPFGIGIGDLFAAGLAGWRRGPLVLTLAGAVTLCTYLAFRIPARIVGQSGSVVGSLALDLVGLIVASTIAYPWYRYALAADRGQTIRFSEPFSRPGRFYAQLVVSFWFWAAFLFGLRYLLGLPSIVVTLLYGFGGFVVADSDSGGLAALGHSVRLGQGKRIGLAGIATLMFLVVLISAIPLGVGRPDDGTDAAADAASFHPLALAATVVTLALATSFVMVMGARLYRTFAGET